MEWLDSQFRDLRQIHRLKRSPAADFATAELRDAILRGVLRPGARLKLDELAARLGMSRTPVRQALSVLEAEGLVKADHSRGTSVAPLNRTLIRDVYKFREWVEGHVAALLAEQKFDPGPARETIAAGRHATSGGDISRMIDLDLRFHTKLYDAVGNQVLSEVMRAQWGHVRRVMPIGLTVEATFIGLTMDDYRHQVWDEHEGILDAIDAHDPERASRLAVSHVVNASVLALRILEAKHEDPLRADSDAVVGA